MTLTLTPLLPVSIKKEQVQHWFLRDQQIKINIPDPSRSLLMYSQNYLQRLLHQQLQKQDDIQVTSYKTRQVILALVGYAEEHMEPPCFTAKCSFPTNDYFTYSY